MRAVLDEARRAEMETDTTSLEGRQEEMRKVSSLALKIEEWREVHREQSIEAHAQKVWQQYMPTDEELDEVSRFESCQRSPDDLEVIECLREMRANHRERQRDRQRKSRLKRRQDAADALGGECVQCGEADIRLLDFDHIEPVGWRSAGEKANGQHNPNTINKMVKDGEDPAQVYQLLCVRCHRLKTFENEDYLANKETENGR